MYIFEQGKFVRLYIVTGLARCLTGNNLTSLFTDSECCYATVLALTILLRTLPCNLKMLIWSMNAFKYSKLMLEYVIRHGRKC